MEQTPKKRGRPKLILTEDVVERRRLLKRIRNNSRRQLNENLHKGSFQGVGTSIGQRGRVEVYSGEGHGGYIENEEGITRAGDVSPQDYVGQDGNENGGTSNHRGTCSRAGDVSLQEYVDQSEDENGVASNPRGTGSRDTRQLLEEIRQKKRNFIDNNLVLDLGKQDQICGFCKAHVWAAEYTGRHVGTGPKGYSICCQKGKVQLPLLRETPLELNELLISTGRRSKKFFNKSRVYNNLFAFCSFGGNVDDSVNRGKGPYVFRMSGQTYHNFGSLVPPDGCSPKFAQLYMYDGQEAIDHRVNFPGNRDEVDPAIVAMLQEMLNRENALVGIFKQARERFNNVEHVPLRLKLLERRKSDGRFENLPTRDDYEFAGLVVDNDFANERDIVAEDRQFGLKHISDLHPCFMSLQYPLLFPHGEDGYRINIKHRNENNSEDRRKSTVSQREYYSFRTQYRAHEGHTLLLGGRLFLQFVVDAWCSVERGRLQWVRTHQSIIRSDLYNNIVDSLRRGDVVATDVGKRVVLPSSFTGGYRYMQQNFQDSLALCKEYGHPDLFITFTCNPKWGEIQSSIQSSGSYDASVRPDIVARVFKMKLDAMIADITKNSLLGRVLAVYSIDILYLRDIFHDYCISFFPQYSSPYQQN